MDIVIEIDTTTKKIGDEMEIDDNIYLLNNCNNKKIVTVNDIDKLSKM
ncbi:12803_t:CDS:2, partial [Gigaspora rosea]